MTFQEFIASIGFKSGVSFWGVVAFLMSIGIEIIPKVKWKPWSSLLEQIDDIRDRINNVASLEYEIVS